MSYRFRCHGCREDSDPGQGKQKTNCRLCRDRWSLDGHSHPFRLPITHSLSIAFHADPRIYMLGPHRTMQVPSPNANHDHFISDKRLTPFLLNLFALTVPHTATGSLRATPIPRRPSKVTRLGMTPAIRSGATFCMLTRGKGGARADLYQHQQPTTAMRMQLHTGRRLMCYADSFST